MTENPTEQPQPTEETTAPEPELYDAPDDVPEGTATGYAVYDRTLGRFVGGVSKDKPSRSDAAAAVDKGNAYKVVRV